MKPEDHLNLSAFLDGELSPEQRHLVEQAIAQGPGVAAELQGLRVVRELVRGLSRPRAPRDITPEVMARLDEQRSLSIPPYWLAAGTILTAAAALLVAIAPSLWGPHTNGSKATVAQTVPKAVAQTVPDVQPAPSKAKVAKAAAASSAQAVAAAAAPPAPGPVGLDPDRSRALALLDRNDLSVVTVDLDSATRASMDQLQAAIGHACVSRPSCGELRPASKSESGSNAPPSIAFLAELTDSEQQHLIAELNQRFPAHVHVGDRQDQDRDVALVRADLGQVQFTDLPTSAAPAPLIEPRPGSTATLAIREHDPDAPTDVEDEPPPASPPGQPVPAPKPPHPCLIWVSAAPPAK